MTNRHKALEAIILEVRKECEIFGQSVEDWKKTAEAVALKYVPELQTKKKAGRPPMSPKERQFKDFLRITEVGYYKNKYGLTNDEAVKMSSISDSTFRKLRAKYPPFWRAALAKPIDGEDYLELLEELMQHLSASIKAERENSRANKYT